MSNDDVKKLKEELDRIEERKLRFGTYNGFDVEQVARMNPAYLIWCLREIPLRPELRRSMLRALSRRSAEMQARGPRRCVIERHANGHQALSGAARCTR